MRKSLSDGLRGWVAGFFDGEGSVWITPAHYANDRGKRRYKQARVRVAIGNTVEESLLLVLKLFGGSIYYRPSKGVEKDSWKWRLEGSKAITFLETIFPYLLIKKQRVIIALSFLKKKDIEHRNRLCERMKILNHKGR